MIALLGMMLLGVASSTAWRSRPRSAVLLVMLASLTLLPALLTIAGARVARPQARRARRAAPRKTPAEHGGDRTPGEGGAWLRWSAFVQRRPRAIAIVAALVMLADRGAGDRAAAGLQRRLERPRGQTTHRAYELLAEGFGQGFNGPLLVVAKVPDAAKAAAPSNSSCAAARRRDPGRRRRSPRPS